MVDAIDGEKLNRNIPLQRQKTSELAFVLRAIATVIASMKKAGGGGGEGGSSTQVVTNNELVSYSKGEHFPFAVCVFQIVDKKTWQQVITLYPYLVQCTDTNNAQVGTSVKEALLQYQDLLQPMGK